jgi:hypothetical protein
MFETDDERQMRMVPASPYGFENLEIYPNGAAFPEFNVGYNDTAVMLPREFWQRRGAGANDRPSVDSLYRSLIVASLFWEIDSRSNFDNERNTRGCDHRRMAPGNHQTGF